MRLDWVPVSAAMLVTGVMALVLGTFLTPSAESAAQVLRMVDSDDNRWMAVSVVHLLAAVALILGLPTVLTLFDVSGNRTAIASIVVLAIGYVGLAGYAIALVFFRALVLSDAVRVDRMDEVTAEPGLVAFLVCWLVAFYLGELLLAIALLRARGVARWIPLALLGHIALLPVTAVLPDGFDNVTILLVAAAFSGLAIAAVDRGRPA